MKTDKLQSPRAGTGRGGFVLRFMTAWANHETLVLLIALVLLIIAATLSSSRYLLSILINCALYSVLAISLNLFTGLLGITSLGHAAFYGFGAYAAGILSTRLGWNILITIPAAMLVSAVFALLLGLPAIKSSPKQFAIITLGFCEMARIIEFNWMEITNGPLGISQISYPKLAGFTFSNMKSRFFLILFFLVVIYYLAISLEKSRDGRAISAIRYNAIAAEAMGVNVYKYKLAVFCLSAAIAGLAGAFYAHHVMFIDPKSFSSEQSTLILSMVILGGMGNLTGSIIGAFILATLPELLRGFDEYRLITYGVIIVIMMVFRPSGILGKYNFRYLRQRYKFSKSAQDTSRSGG